MRKPIINSQRSAVRQVHKLHAVNSLLKKSMVFFKVTFIFSFFTFCILLFSGCMEQSQPVYAKKIALKNLQEDFNYYRMILESAHPGLYQYTSVNAMKHLFDSTYNTLNADESIFEFYNKLSYITNQIRCAHTSLFFPENISDTLDNTDGFFPIPLAYIQGKLVVNSDLDDNLPLGATVVSINNVPADKILSSLEMYESVDGYVPQFQLEEATADFAQNYFFKYGPQKSFVVKYTNPDFPQQIIMPEKKAANKKNVSAQMLPRQKTQLKMRKSQLKLIQLPLYRGNLK